MLYYVDSGEVSIGISLTEDDEMDVLRGGVAKDTTVNNGGCMYVDPGAEANDTTVNNGGSMYVDGGTANNTIVNGAGFWESGELYVSGGVVVFTIVNSAGDLFLDQDSIATTTTLNNGGSMYVSCGGLASETTVNSGASVYVEMSGSVKEAVVNGGGVLEVANGGVAEDITECGGFVKLAEDATATFVPNTFSGAQLSACSATLHSGTTANDTVIDSLGRMEIYQGGKANQTTVNSGGNLLVNSSGAADATTVNDGGALYISSGGEASATTVNSGGKVFVASNGLALGATVNDGGRMHVSGKASATVVNGADQESNGELYVCEGGSASATTVDNYGWMSIDEGGFAADITVNSGGKLLISAGGEASDLKENGGYVEVATGAQALFAANEFSGLELSSGSATLHSGTTATATTVLTSGTLYVFGGVANATVLTGDDRWDCAEMYVYNDGLANGTTVNGGGWMLVAGLANSTTVGSDGYLGLAAGGKHTGSLTISEGAVVSAYAGSLIDFCLVDSEPDNTAFVNDLSLIQGTPEYTITVSSTQATGVYQLADGASGFNGTITVVNDAGQVLGDVALGHSLVVLDNRYRLNLSEGMLTLSIGPALLPSDLVGTVDGMSWTSAGADSYTLVFTPDDYAHIIMCRTLQTGLDTFNLPTGTYSWQVKADDIEQWVQGNDFVSENSNPEAKAISSVANDTVDMFFARTTGTWRGGFYAEHDGVLDVWAGTQERVALAGKNRLVDTFTGSSDLNFLLLTDDDNGDALFVEDLFTAQPESLTEPQARIDGILEICAGAGDDMIDMTSQRFAYNGWSYPGLSRGVAYIRGGDGNDTIWANAGNNMLYGDKGNDRLVGATNNDLLVGGVGNDSMHGGGGQDIFTFGGNWGNDTVEQLADSGTITLWFDGIVYDDLSLSADSNGDAILQCNQNSVTIIGVKATDIEDAFNAHEIVLAPNLAVQFGDDIFGYYQELVQYAAFVDYTHEKIFDDNNTRMLAVGD